MAYNVLDFLDGSVARYPDKIAVREENATITYSELARRAKAIGTALLEYSVFGNPIGVYMEKGIDALSAFLGIVSAGGCYCMLAPELPEKRLGQILDVLDAKLVLTTSDRKARADEIFPEVTVLSVEKMIHAEINEAALRRVREQTIDTDPLYINFTSGSTGIPKGIAVAHRSVIDFIEHFTPLFGIGSDDVIANQAPFDFDVSVKDIYSALQTGATLVVVPRKLFSAPAPLLDYLCDNRVTTLIWAVSALCLITTFHGLEYKTPYSVRRVLFSGEVMPYKHLKQWRSHLPNATFVNLYGPTEITCNCTYHILDPDRDYSDGVPIGKSFPNEDVFLLDDGDKKITEPGVVGRIIVRGTALALGYYRLDDKTAASFIQNPLHSSYPEPVYVTGDLGRYDENGDLVFCGRTDNQIKYLGHRIELEEIERNIYQIDGVDRCFCVFENEKLKGYYVGQIDKTALHTHLRATLPPFMVPGFLRRLDEMPMTKNGKIDRKAAIAIAEGGNGDVK